MHRSVLFALILGLAALGAWFFAPAENGGITLSDAYARASNARAGAVFLTIGNDGAQDRLVAVRSDAAARVELHDHLMTDGVMQMVHAEQGFALEAGQQLVLERGGKHIMFMGLTAPWQDGGQVRLTLIFERAGEVELAVPVDLSR